MVFFFWTQNVIGTTEDNTQETIKIEESGAVLGSDTLTIFNYEQPKRVKETFQNGSEKYLPAYKIDFKS